MAEHDVLWSLEPHTRGKHLVLEQYLAAWWPIMASTQKKILFIDGFAGPGRYLGGEDGSPIIALRSFLEHNARQIMRAQTEFWFIEKKPKNFEYLTELCGQWKQRLPSNCKAEVIPGTFDRHLTAVMDALNEQESALSPAFVMIDPFGVSGTPMDVLRRVLQNPKSELFITYMFEFINRFKSTPAFEEKLDALYGCGEWRTTVGDSDRSVHEKLFELYERQLRAAGARYVLRFNLYKQNRLFYAVFFCTHDLTGCDKMKQAMWKVSPFGDYSFHGYHTNQLTLGIEEVDFLPFRRALQDRYRNRDWLRIESIEQFAQSDETDYHSGHLKTKTLRPMEDEGVIQIDPASRKRKGTFPGGTRIRFL